MREAVAMTKADRPRIPAIRIDLYEEQAAELEPIMLEAKAAADAGVPGFIAAQVFGGSMCVFFIDHERALKFQELMGQKVGARTARPVIDGTPSPTGPVRTHR
jgi:hypothetical protein